MLQQTKSINVPTFDAITSSMDLVDKPSLEGTVILNKMKHWENLSLENLTEEVDGIIYTEEWRDIKGYEGLYQVSNFGRVKSLSIYRFHKKYKNKFLHNGRILKQYKTGKGKKEQKYFTVKLCVNNTQFNNKVHSLVCIHFIPNPYNKLQTNHRNGDKENNSFENLEWMTCKENIDHAVKNNLVKRNYGENHPLSKLKNKDIKKIRIRLKNGDTLKSISIDYKVSITAIWSIKSNKTHKKNYEL